MIEKYDFIKHEKFMDVAFEVEYVDNSYSSDSIMVTGFWWNQGYERSWHVPYFRTKRDRAYGIPSMQTFFIKKSELGRWSKLVLPRKDEQCLRRCDWEPAA